MMLYFVYTCTVLTHNYSMLYYYCSDYNSQNIHVVIYFPKQMGIFLWTAFDYLTFSLHTEYFIQIGVHICAVLLYMYKFVEYN